MHPGLPEISWDKLLVTQNGHFLQSREWMQFQIELGRTVFSDHGDVWSWIATARQTLQFRYLASAYGPTATPLSLADALDSIVVAAKKQKVDFVRIEPLGVTKEELRVSGYKLVALEEIEPEITSLIDLSLSEEELRHNLSSGHRNAINGAERRGIVIREGKLSSDIDEFNRLMRQTAQKAGIRVHDASYFKTMMRVLSPAGRAKLYLAEAEGKAIAATIIYSHNKIWYYAHAASDPEFVKLQAGVPLLWRAIMDAKAAGAGEFDLWGVVPVDDAHSSKSGYSRFKRAFGGVDRVYAGTWDLIINPGRYRLFKLARNASRVVRKLRRT